METRSGYFDRMEVRRSSTATTSTATIKGCVCVFDVATDLQDFWEIVKKGAFASSIKENDIRLIHNHNPDFVLARQSAGNLRLWESDHGLMFEAQISLNNPMAVMVADGVEVGNLRGMSYGFFVTKDQWQDQNSMKPTRITLDTHTFEISTCTWPAEPRTSLAMGSGDGRSILPAFDPLRNQVEAMKRLEHNRLRDEIDDLMGDEISSRAFKAQLRAECQADLRRRLECLKRQVA